MMFYNKGRWPVVYSDDNINIFHFNGEPLAYIDGNYVFSYDGDHLGYFVKGWILDKEGKKVFFTKNAKNCLGVKEIYPVIEPKQEIPKAKEPGEKPEIPKMKETWSEYSNIDFFKR
ncbi:MAG: hypothetical protein R6V04_02450 [bacterium]